MSFEEWREVRLGEVCSKVGSGATPTGGANAYCDKGISLIRSQNILDFKFSINGLAYINETQAKKLDNVIIEEGDVLLNITGDSVARNCIVPTEVLPARVNQHVAIIRGNYNQIDNRYILYCLQHNKTYLLSISGTGGTRNALTKKMLENFNILLPSLPEQKAIADTLTCLDDKIELNNRINKILEEMAQAIFKSWFVDFEPFQDGEFEDSELGRIPKGWRIEKIKNIADINRSTRKNGYIHETIEYIDISAVTQGYLKALSEYSIDQAPSRAQRLVAHGDTIWSCVRPNRRSYLYVQNPKENWVVSTGFTVLTPMKVPASYLYIWTTTNAFVDYLTANADGSAYPAVRPSHFAEADIIIPPPNVLEDFDNIVDFLILDIELNAKENSKLAAIRDTLLPKLMSGEIRVPIQEVQ